MRKLNSLLTQDVHFKYNAEMADIVKALLRDLSRPPALVFPDWDAVADNNSRTLLCAYACIDDLGASLEQEQVNGSVGPIVYPSYRAQLDCF